MWLKEAIIMELLEIKEVAGILRVSPRMVWQMRDGGRIPQPVKVGRLCRWRRSDIEEWIAAGCPACRPLSQSGRNARRAGI